MLRNVLVVGQFTGAVFLIIATIFVLKQLRYMQKKDRGFSSDQIMLVPLDRETYRNYETLKQELAGSTLVTAVTASQQRLGNNIHQNGGIRYHGKGPVRELVTSSVVVDCDYLRTYRIKLIAGSDFSRDKANNAREYIINESLAKELLRGEGSGEPVESLIGKRFGYGGMDSTGLIITWQKISISIPCITRSKR